MNRTKCIAHNLMQRKSQNAVLCTVFINVIYTDKSGHDFHRLGTLLTITYKEEGMEFRLLEEVYR